MAMRKTIRGTVVAITVAAILMMISVLAVRQTAKNVPNSGSVKGVNVGLYQDSGCTVPLASISWGLLDPGASANKSFYVKNEGNAVVVLSMTSNAWNPVAAQGYMGLTWNREGTSVALGNSVQAVLTLTVFANVTGITDFSFNVTVTGTS